MRLTDGIYKTKQPVLYDSIIHDNPACYNCGEPPILIINVFGKYYDNDAVRDSYGVTRTESKHLAIYVYTIKSKEITQIANIISNENGNVHYNHNTHNCKYGNTNDAIGDLLEEYINKTILTGYYILEYYYMVYP